MVRVLPTNRLESLSVREVEPPMAEVIGELEPICNCEPSVSTHTNPLESVLGSKDLVELWLPV